MSHEFDKFRELLKEQEFPLLYLYKFIVKNEPSKVNAIKNCFDENAEIQLHPSKNGNFVSLSIKEVVLSIESIIDKYKMVGKIEGVIAL